MSENEIIVGLDVGTTKVCSVIGQINQTSGLEIIGVGTKPSNGLKKGSVVNIDKTVASIKASLGEAQLMAGVQVTSATVGIAGSHIFSFNNSGVVAVKGTEITEDDVNRAVEAAKAVVIPSDREILHVIPQEFKVDNTSGIKDPVGMCGIRLEVYVHIVTGMISLIQNMAKCVELAGLHVNDIVLQPVASSESVLSSGEKDVGVVLIDVGGGTTDVAIWKSGSLIHSQIIPIGGNHFTNDLAVALKIPYSEAERIKTECGCVLAEKINQSQAITVQGLSGTRPREIRLSMIAKVLGARSEELFGIVKNILEEKNLRDVITGGFVLTGGGVLIEALPELAEYLLERPVKLGYPIPFGGMTKVMQNPKFSTVLGLLQRAEKNSIKNVSGDVARNQRDIIGKLSKSIKNVFREIF